MFGFRYSFAAVRVILFRWFDVRFPQFPDQRVIQICPLVVFRIYGFCLIRHIPSLKAAKRKDTVQSVS